MKRHLNMVHNDCARKFKWEYPDCPSNGFIDNYHLRRHIKSVHNKEFVWNIWEDENKLLNPENPIPFRFKKKNQLKKHMEQIHADPAQFQCKFWSKSFNKQKKFEAHMQRHEEKI